MIKLSIIIPVFEKLNYTMSCLKDLSQLPNDHEIIVVDNSHSNETQEKLKDHQGIANFLYIKNETNTFSNACNTGYALSRGSNVMFLNNDIRVKCDHNTWTQNIINLTDGNDACIVGPTGGLLDRNNNFVYETREPSKRINYISGWCVSGSRKAFEKLRIGNGPFDEDYSFYFEDADLSFRAHKLGMVLVLQEIPVVHFGKVSTDKNKIGRLYIDGKQIFDRKWRC